MKEYDVAVCGAGTAGVAAAVAAARRGARTLLIEKQCLLGGLATSGLIYVYLPLDDGYGHRTGSGLAWEMMHRSIEYGPFDLPKAWGGPVDGDSGLPGNRLRCGFSPGGFCLSLDRMLQETGVDVWLDSRIYAAGARNDRVVSLTVANDSGSVEIAAKCFVDATGGAFVVRIAGGNVEYGENFNTPWFFDVSEHAENYKFTDRVSIRRFGKLIPEFRFGECRDGRDVSKFIRDSWQMIREIYDEVPKDKKRANFPLMLPPMPQLRQIAYADSLYTLKDEDSGGRFEDSVGVVSDWRRPGPVWEVPYRALLPRKVRGVLTAGRCIGAAGDAWDVFRVIPAAVITGEAAGIAAAMAASNGCDPVEVPVAELRKELVAAGAVVDAAPDWGIPTEKTEKVPEYSEV